MNRTHEGPPNDESGLIDIHALMTKAQLKPADEPTPMPVVSHIPIYPFGAPLEESPPQPVKAAEAPPEKARWSRRGQVFLAIGALALAGVTGAFVPAMLHKQAAPELRTGVPASDALAARPETSPLPPPQTSPPLPPKEASAAPPDTTTARTTPGKNVPRSVPAKPLPPPKTPPAGKPLPPPVSPADPCKGDLLCSMKRATEHH